MNTTGNSNRDLCERYAPLDRLIIEILRHLLPPQADNEQAAEFLRTVVGQNDETLEWAAVRPDNLVDEDQVSEYEVFSSPTRSPIFDAGITSRIDVADFMARLIVEDDVWGAWKGRMPVVYNKGAA
jgi:hypothetical protein